MIPDGVDIINIETGVVKIVKTHIKYFQLFMKLDPRDCFIIYQDVVESIKDIEIVLDNNIDQNKRFSIEDVKMQKIKDVKN